MTTVNNFIQSAYDNGSVSSSSTTIDFDKGDFQKITLSGSSSGKGWSITSSLNTARAVSGFGVYNAAIACGGYTGGYVNSSEKWSGSSWSTTGNLVVSRGFFPACGTTTSAFAFGGTSSTLLSSSEKWSGTSWATSSTMTAVRYNHAGCGSTSSALVFGGGTSASGSEGNITEIWNGTSWSTTSGYLKTGRYDFGGCGTTSDALSFGGDPGTGYLSSTEIWGTGTVGIECSVSLSSSSTSPKIFHIEVVQGSLGSETVSWSDDNINLNPSLNTLSCYAGEIDMITFYFDGSSYWGWIGNYS